MVAKSFQSIVLLWYWFCKKYSFTNLSIAPIKTATERRAEVVAAVMEAVEMTSNDDFELGPFFGLPSKVLDVLRAHRGISKLYG